MRLDTKPHPIRVTSMYILDEALQKMRKVEARQNSEEYNKTLHRWRGIKDRDLDLDTFKRVGGTKLTPLSTTAKRPVAEAFTKGQQRRLIFRYTTGGPRHPLDLRSLSLSVRCSGLVRPDTLPLGKD